MRTTGLTLDDHMIYSLFSFALPAEYEVEAGNLAPRDSIGRHEITKAVRERHHPLYRNGKSGSNAGHAGQAMYAGGGGGGDGGGRGKGGGSGRERGGRWGQQG